MGGLGAGLMGLGGSGILSGGGGGVSATPTIRGSSGVGSGGLMSGLSASVLDSLGNNGMFSSGGSASMDRGAGIGSMMDDRMESRMSGGGNMYSSSGGGGGGRVSYDRAPEYERSRTTSMDYDRGDRGSSDPYARADTSTVFVRNVGFQQFLLLCHFIYQI